MFTKFKTWWLFHLANPIVREGAEGGFKWKFRRFTFEAETLSGNFKARWTADAHPYAYLLASQGDENIHGFLDIIYLLSKTLTTDQKLVTDMGKAIKSFEGRLAKSQKEDGEDEKQAIEEVKAVQEYVDASPKEKRAMERESNKRFKKAVKEFEKK